MHKEDDVVKILICLIILHTVYTVKEINAFLDETFGKT